MLMKEEMLFPFLKNQRAHSSCSIARHNGFRRRTAIYLRRIFHTEKLLGKAVGAVVIDQKGKEATSAQIMFSV
jgi:hypothetical protein